MRELKLLIDENVQNKGAKEEKLKAFTAGYEMYVTELHKQRKALEFQIRNLRDQIISAQNPVEKAEHITELIEDPISTEQPEAETNVQQIELADDSLVKKENIRRHFARFWHPDVTPKSVDQNLMTKLNMVFSQSSDEIDLLAYIPWNSAWEKPSKGESLGAQWERLMDWNTDLQCAMKRIEDQIIAIENNPYYPLLPEWESIESKADFFARLAEDERKQIRQLEETIKALQRQLDEITNAENN